MFLKCTCNVYAIAINKKILRVFEKIMIFRTRKLQAWCELIFWGVGEAANTMSEMGTEVSWDIIPQVIGRKIHFRNRFFLNYPLSLDNTKLFILSLNALFSTLIHITSFGFILFLIVCYKVNFIMVHLAWEIGAFYKCIHFVSVILVKSNWISWLLEGVFNLLAHTIFHEKILK